MNPIPNLTAANARREYIFAEFRCALIKAKLTMLDIHACALNYNIVSPAAGSRVLLGLRGGAFPRLELKGPA